MFEREAEAILDAITNPDGSLVARPLPTIRDALRLQSEMVTCRACAHERNEHCLVVGSDLSNPDAPFRRSSCDHFIPRSHSSQPVAGRVAATETGGTEAPGETVVASSSCGACSAMRERAEAAEAALTVVRFWFEHDSGIQRALRERREWREEPGMLEAAAAALSSGVLR